jgi:hypothetical protein
MPEYSAPIQGFAIARTLWLVVALPLLGAVATLLAASGAVGREAMGRRVAMLSSVLTWVAAGAHAITLAARSEGDRLLVEPLWRGVRVGQLDASFGLAMDIVAGAMLSVLADGFFPLLVGGQCIAVGLIATDRARAARRFAWLAVSDAGLVAGAALLFWSLGGDWIGGDYTPSLSLRIVVVREGGLTAEEEDERADKRRTRSDSVSFPALLTVEAYPDGLVYLDGARTPLLGFAGKPLRTPFQRMRVPGGTHTIRVHPGDGSDDFVVSRVRLDPGLEVALGTIGPSTNFREIDAQLAFEDAHGHAVVASSVARRVMGGVGALATALVTIGLSVLLRLAQCLESRHLVGVRIIAAAAAVVVLIRLAPAITLASSPASFAMFLVGALAVVAALRAESVLLDGARSLEHRLREMDRWVIDAILGAAARMAHVAAWIVSWIDRDRIDGPLDAAAGRCARAARAFGPIALGNVAAYALGGALLLLVAAFGLALKVAP